EAGRRGHSRAGIGRQYGRSATAGGRPWSEQQWVCARPCSACAAACELQSAERRSADPAGRPCCRRLATTQRLAKHFGGNKEDAGLALGSLTGKEGRRASAPLSIW